MPNLLVVDDDATIRAMFVRVLRSLGDVDEAKDGADALRLLGAKQYDAILLDWHLPGLDGHAVLKTLDKPGPNRGTPVIVVTADGSERAKATALTGGAVFFLNKPVQLATLAVFVKSTLGKRRA